MQFKQIVHRALIRTQGIDEIRYAGSLRRAVSAAADRRWGDTHVTAVLHGREVSINFSNPYPFYVHQVPNYNAPQVELVLASSLACGRPVRVVDVGAAIGDTALLLLERCGDQIARLDCVEGSLAFADLLEKNLNDARVHVHRTMLSDRSGLVPSLVSSQHAGTASAEGAELESAVTLDELLSGAAPDVVKVDADGYDGRILAGATSTLRDARPSILFEWHPIMCERLGTDEMEAFTVLEAAGYDRYIFFTKFGQFSHFGLCELEKLSTLCRTSGTLYDWHFDVIALRSDSDISEVEVADLRRWGNGGW